MCMWGYFKFIHTIHHCLDGLSDRNNILEEIYIYKVYFDIIDSFVLWICVIWSLNSKFYKVNQI